MRYNKILKVLFQSVFIMNLKNQYSLLVFLSFLSGVCGLAYEILYAKMISSYLGDIFYISAAVLFTFFLGLGIGSIVAHKFSKYLYAIEAAIGIYSLLAVTIFYFFSDSIVLFAYQIPFFGPTVLVILTTLLLLIPSTLIGFCVPLFTHYLKKIQPKTSSFSTIYLAYNLGAAFCVLLVEFFLIRTFGVFESFLIIIAINILTAVLLYYFFEKIEYKSSIISFENISTNKPLYTSLFVLNVITAIFYLVFFQLLNYIYGPIHENFAISVFISLFAISIATWLVHKFPITLKTTIFFGSIIIPLLLSLTLGFIYLWTFLQDQLSLSGFEFIALKIFISTVYLGIPYMVFGSIEPIYLKEYSKKVTTGNILGVSSFGTSLGFLLYTFFLYGILSYLLIIIIGSGMLLATGIFLAKKISKSIIVVSTLFIITCMIFSFFWPGDILHVGFNNFKNVEQLDSSLRDITNIQSYQKYDNSVSIVYFQGRTWLVHNGYATLSFSSDKRTQLHETIVGLAGVPFINSTNNALVFGLGSGITVGALAEQFNHVEVSEINPVMEEILDEFKDFNYNLTSKDNVKITTQDAYITLLKDTKKYDLIVNTVPSPYFYSASKLWTKDVFDEVSKRLTKQGVFTAWFDLRVGLEGIKTMSKTFESSFEQCEYLLLSYGYFLVVCGNEPLEYMHQNQNYFSENIQQVFAKEQITNISEYMYYRFYEPSKELYNTPEVPINTINLPVLEFETAARIQSNAIIRANLDALIFNNFATNPFTQKTYTDEELQKKCELLRKGNRFIPNVKQC